MTLQESIDRLAFLRKHGPDCPKCPPPKCIADKQVQLVEWVNCTALWKCRKCKYKWEYEPPK